MQSMRSQALKERRSSQCVAAKGRPPPCICRASACSFCPVAVIHAASIASGSIKTDSGKRPWAPSNETSCCFQSSCTRRLHARSLRKKHGESFAPHVWEGPTPEKPEPVVLEVSNFMWQEAIFTRWQFSEILWGKGMGFFGNLDFPPNIFQDRLWTKIADLEESVCKMLKMLSGVFCIRFHLPLSKGFFRPRRAR